MLAVIEKHKTSIGIMLVAAIMLGGALVMIGQNQATHVSFSQESPVKHPGTVPVGEPQVTGTSTQRELRVNINTADIAELDILPGIGEKTAQKIIDYRTQHGAFKSPEEIKNVSGIGDAKYEDMKDMIAVE